MRSGWHSAMMQLSPLALDIFQTTYGYTDFISMKNEIILATYLEKHIEEKELFAAPYMYLPILVAITLKIIDQLR